MANCHPRDYSPLGWEIRDRIEFEGRAPKRAEGIAYLTADDPGAYVPCGRYGSDAADHAPVAWRLAYLIAREQGEPITFHSLDYMMGLVVNGHSYVAYVIRQYGHRMYR